VVGHGWGCQYLFWGVLREQRVVRCDLRTTGILRQSNQSSGGWMASVLSSGEQKGFLVCSKFKIRTTHRKAKRVRGTKSHGLVHL